MREGTANLIDILLSILLPPLGVFRRFGCHVEFWICLLLTIWGYLLGIIYAIYVNTLPPFQSWSHRPRSPLPWGAVSMANCANILLALLLPPLGVFRKFGCHVEFWICFLLTIWDYLPGIIYAIYVITLPPFLFSSHQPHSPLPSDAVSTNAFHEIAPEADASTSSSKKSCYDVFINHRGKDVKHKLASTIYNMLDVMGVPAFLDQEELEKGDSFPHGIEEAMRGASVHIAIFSPSYAESPWCLEELSLMLRIKVTIIPVFYSVRPSDLRYIRKGIYADAFREHERKRRYNPQKIKEWEEALGKVSYLDGCIMDADKCDEGKLLREIVEIALRKIKKVPLGVATFPVGLDQAVQDFESKVGSSKGSENVHIVGIVGMGGSGKTTLAKELYNRKCSSFRQSSFLLNVRDAASTNTLHKLQKKLLKDLRIKHPEFDNKDEGIGMLARYLRSTAVMIVLDDVDDVDQIEALLPHETMHNLGPGSFIIVTTREVDVLKSREIFIYHIKELDPVNAKKLFCTHASLHQFTQLVENDPNFQDPIRRFLSLCKGLPLALKVFGAMVNGKSKDYWESQLLKMSRILPQDIVRCLKVSYDALDPEVQQMFLDIACFFIGLKKSLIVPIWDGSEWSGEVGWVTLVNKCLIGLDTEGNIDMHDLLRDLGREIATGGSPSRIWKEGQINIQEGKTPIRGIVAATGRPSWSSILKMDTYYRLPLEHCMENFIKGPSLRALKLLAMRGNDFREEFAASSRDLVWLRLWKFDGANLPSWLSLSNLRVLELYEAENLEQLWQDNVEPPLQLRELIIEITGNTSFLGLPSSIGRLRHLKKILLNGSYSYSGMRSLPEEFCHLESLEFLQLSYFPVLSSLPDDFGKLINLRSLTLRAVQLTALPDSVKQLTALQSLSIQECKSFILTSEMLDVLEFMTELQVLDIAYCPLLEELPHLITQASLKTLVFWYTGLRELPSSIRQLTTLQTLHIGSDNLRSLPESLGALSCLTSLKIGGDNLTSLPEYLGALSCLTSLEIGSCGMLESLPEALGRLSNLQYLIISSTPLLEIGFGIGSPSRCNLKSLKFLRFQFTKLCRISISDDCFPGLETLELFGNYNLTEIETLPGNIREIRVERCTKLKNMRGIGGLLNLVMLELHDCPYLEVVPCPTYMHSVGHTISIARCPKAGII